MCVCAPLQTRTPDKSAVHIFHGNHTYDIIFSGTIATDQFVPEFCFPSYKQNWSSFGIQSFVKIAIHFLTKL